MTRRDVATALGIRDPRRVEKWMSDSPLRGMARSPETQGKTPEESGCRE